MSEGQLQSQAEEFLQDGAYSLDIVDLAIAALSNMLQTPLFSSHPDQTYWTPLSEFLNPPLCPAYESQCVPLQGKRTVKFMEAVGEPVSIGGFSKMEYLLICSIVQLKSNVRWMGLGTSTHVNVGDVSTIYHYILELAQTLQLDLALLEREQDSIEKLICYKR